MNNFEVGDKVVIKPLKDLECRDDFEDYVKGTIRRDYEYYEEKNMIGIPYTITSIHEWEDDFKYIQSVPLFKCHEPLLFYLEYCNEFENELI